MKKRLGLRLSQLTVLMFFIGVPHVLRADGHTIPVIAVYGMVAGFLLGGLAASLVISFLLRTVLEIILGEKRKHIWWMVLFTMLFPSVVIYAEEEHQLLYSLEMNYTYEIRKTVLWSLFVFSIIAGFLVGFFITPKKSVT